MKKAIFLDWDGVLCDSLQLHFDLYAEACKRHDKTFPIADLNGFRSWYNPRWEQNYYDMGFTEEQFREVQKFSESYLQYSNARLFPGVPECLASWAAVYPLAIVSTTPSPLIRARLVEAKLDHHFTAFVGGEDGESEKRAKLARALEKLGVEGGVMVGDTALDVDAGRFNNLRTVGVTYGWVLPQRVVDAAPDRIVNDPALLEQTVLELAAG